MGMGLRSLCRTGIVITRKGILRMSTVIAVLKVKVASIEMELCSRYRVVPDVSRGWCSDGHG